VEVGKTELVVDTDREQPEGVFQGMLTDPRFATRIYFKAAIAQSSINRLIIHSFPQTNCRSLRAQITHQEYALRGFNWTLKWI